MTAARLADQGHDVLMLEEHATIGTPVHCTGLLASKRSTSSICPAESS